MSCISTSLPSRAAPSPPDDLWLEEVDGDRALSWVKEENGRSLPRLEQDPHFEPLRTQLLSILNAPDRLPNFYIRKNEVYDFWQDAKNVRGLVRRTTWKSYQAGKPKWEVVLDVDKLAKDEKENWVYGGFSIFRDRAIVSLSRGGKDAKVFREFDVRTKTFVPDGFSLTEGKHHVDWFDENTLLVGLAVPGEVTDSGYPLKVRQWKRGTPISDSAVLATGIVKDISMRSAAIRDDFDEPTRHVVFFRSIDFYNTDHFLWRNGQAEPIPLPTDADISFDHDNVFITLRKDWVAHGKTFKAGSLLRADLAELMAGQTSPDVVFAPTEKQVLLTYTAVKNRIFVGTMNDVSVRWSEMVQNSEHAWQERKLNLPDNADISVLTSSEAQGLIVFEIKSFLIPGSRTVYDVSSGTFRFLEQAKDRFDSSPYQVRQFFATSRDGTRVPYYLVARKDLEPNGRNPTLLNAYGGFEASKTPFYSYALGLGWLDKGGVYVLANIRGGGEYGPSWHQAALKENRQRAFDDFFAVAEDLIARKVTNARKLGAFGGSNGGLLMGVAMTQRPDLFEAIAIQVPLLDMLRYHKLLAGASWMGEYGDPDDEKIRAAILRYSPYHNIRPDQKYPEVFFMTSKADDRVHPGHARRTAALMKKMKHPYLYYENIEGGHGGAANLKQRAYWWALQYTYFRQKLIDR